MMIERIEINLLPAEYRIHKKTLKIPRAVIYPALLFVILAVTATLYSVYLREEEAELQSEIEAITAEIQANRHIQTEINALRKNMEITEQKIRALEKISVDREKWVRLLEILSANLPSYSWLTSVREQTAPPRLNLEARTYSFPEVAQYMTKLEESEFIKEVELTGIDQMQGDGRMMFRFTLICMLDADAGMPPGGVTNEESNAEAAESGGGRRRRR